MEVKAAAQPAAAEPQPAHKEAQDVPATMEYTPAVPVVVAAAPEPAAAAPEAEPQVRLGPGAGVLCECALLYELTRVRVWLPAASRRMGHGHGHCALPGERCRAVVTLRPFPTRPVSTPVGPRPPFMHAWR